MLLRARMVKPISRIVGGSFYPASLVYLLHKSRPVHLLPRVSNIQVASQVSRDITAFALHLFLGLPNHIGIPQVLRTSARCVFQAAARLFCFTAELGQHLAANTDTPSPADNNTRKRDSMAFDVTRRTGDDDDRHERPQSDQRQLQPPRSRSPFHGRTSANTADVTL